MGNIFEEIMDKKPSPEEKQAEETKRQQIEKEKLEDILKYLSPNEQEEYKMLNEEIGNQGGFEMLEEGNSARKRRYDELHKKSLDNNPEWQAQLKSLENKEK